MVYPQKVTPTGVDNYLFTTYFYNAKKTYNLRGATQSSSDGEVLDLKMNPSGSSFAVLSLKSKGIDFKKNMDKATALVSGLFKKKNKKKQSQLANAEETPAAQEPEKAETIVKIYDLWKNDGLLFEFDAIEEACAICYSPDSRRIAIANKKGEVEIFDTKTYQSQGKIQLTFAPTEMAISANNYYLAIAGEQGVNIYNLDTKTVRKEIPTGAAVNSIAFSGDCNTFACLTADGILSLYGTRSFIILQTIEAMGTANHCHFSTDDKYISVVTGNNRIAIINLLDTTDRTYVDNPQGGINDARFVKDGKQRTFLAYNTTSSITYKPMGLLSPNYTKLMGEELSERMNDWMKQMPGETLEDYNRRVNDDTRAQQMLLFEQEIATRMADNLLQRSDVKLGSYDTESNMLAVEFNTMPSIYLPVPKNEVADFMNPGNLEFRDAVYGLSKNDKFELVYANVYNKATGKVYTFDNRDRQSLDFLDTGDNFVPMELVKQSNMEELKLQEIKEKIVDQAKKKNTISDHTQIGVNARVVSDVDANGNKIMNYRINFDYQVQKEFSAREDFAPGRYKREQSGAAMSMLSIIQTAFENEFAQYVKAGKKVIVKITGMADALPINGSIAYDGCYGEFVNEPVYKNNDLTNLTVTSKAGITTNEQLAFMRAEGVKEYICNRIQGIQQMETEYRQYIQVTEGKGGEFRRINVEFTFVNAF